MQSQRASLGAWNRNAEARRDAAAAEEAAKASAANGGSPANTAASHAAHRGGYPVKSDLELIEDLDKSIADNRGALEKSRAAVPSTEAEPKSPYRCSAAGFF